jgi:hypothetical protein
MVSPKFHVSEISGQKPMVTESLKMRFSALLSALSVAIAVALVWPAGAAPLDDGPGYGPELQGFDYPWRLQHFRFTAQGDALGALVRATEGVAPLVWTDFSSG